MSYQATSDSEETNRREEATEALPCPSPDCTHSPAPGDRYCDGCGTWLGVEGEKPPSTGPLGKALRTTGALKLASIVERVEGKLNDWCE